MFFLDVFRPLRPLGNKCKTIVMKNAAKTPILRHFRPKAFEKAKKQAVDLCRPVLYHVYQ